MRFLPAVFPCPLSFIRNTCPSHFNRICLILLDIGICCVLYLIVSCVILSSYVVRMNLLNKFDTVSHLGKEAFH